MFRKAVGLDKFFLNCPSLNLGSGLPRISLCGYGEGEISTAPQMVPDETCSPTTGSRLGPTLCVCVCVWCGVVWCGV